MSTSDSGVSQTIDGYQRGLGARQIQMMAIGGAIGTGLFLGAGTAIAKAGPSLILCYAVAGIVIFFIMRALGELLMYRPVAGSFATYAREFIGPWAGFVTGWTYWAVWVTTGMAELTAAGKFVNYWWPEIPQWVTAFVALLILLGVNLISVKIFGEAEFYFAGIKILAIIGMIVIGLGVLTFGFGSPAADTASFANLWNHGGFAPNGIGQTLLAMQIVMFAYVGVELIGVTAGESKNPEKVLPKAINTIPLRIVIFYIASLVVILSVVSWVDFEEGTSPFVAAFAKIGIPAAAGIVNFVVLTSALSSCNAGGFYSTSRMLRTLATQHEAPKVFSKLSSQAVPSRALFLSGGVMGIGVIVNALAPEEAFTYITSVATVGILWVWGVIVFSHLRYRRAVAAGKVKASKFRMPGSPVTNWIVLAFLAFVFVLLTFDAATRVAIYVALGFGIILAIGWFTIGRRGETLNAQDAGRQPVEHGR
ncbi:amino acid permease [Saxibacter everestensis]|uniref:Amino acid permease n=1 Tax=Saxibacter everestensis TaxID=2909229 RepID=A0ABY8QPL8_9MICO|nr:amino acid permease [Brevibacteriaceae bacterium ZFBP1038]